MTCRSDRPAAGRWRDQYVRSAALARSSARWWHYAAARLSRSMPPATASCKPAKSSGWSAAASMISQYRQNNGLGAVEIDPALIKLAEQQSLAMAVANKMDHDVKAPLAKRLNGAGYPATLAVENVSAGYHTLAEAFSGWRDSPPHKANMLKNGVTKLGIAASYAPNTKYKVFWTLIMASTEVR